jgi:hypothetical protein
MRNFTRYSLITAVCLGGATGALAFILDMGGLWKGNLQLSADLYLLPLLVIAYGLTFGLPVSLAWWLIFYFFIRACRHYAWVALLAKRRMLSFLFSIIYGLLSASIFHFFLEIKTGSRLMSVIDIIYIPSLTVSIFLLFYSRQRFLEYLETTA